METEKAYSDLRRLDGKTITAFREIVAEFANVTATAKQKSDAERDNASKSQAIGVILADAIASPANVESALGAPRERADAFAAHIMWLSESPLLPGRS